MNGPDNQIMRYERLVRKLPSIITLSVVGFGLVLGVPWALGAHGGVELLPPSVILNLWAGEKTSYLVDIHNGLGGQATVTFHVRVYQAPAGGNPFDLKFSYPSSITLGPGSAKVLVNLQVQGGAVPGQYLLVQWVVQA